METSFNHSESISKLATAFVSAQSEMPKVIFDTRNPFLKNQYASLGAVIDTSRPVLAKHRLAIIQNPTSGPGSIEKQETSEGSPTSIKRTGVESIGLETILLHESGEWLSQTVLVSLTSEKGKSMAQVAGSILSYLRRYSWSAILGLYADEDTDGNDADHDQAGSRPYKGQSPSQPSNRPTDPKPEPSPAKLDEDVVKLIRMIGPNRAAWEKCLQTREVNDQHQVVVDGPLEKISPAWAKYFIANFDAEMSKVEMWSVENGDAKPPSSQDDTQAAWRKFPMPWGDKKNTPLENLDKKYLFGLWANYNPEAKTSQGKTKTDEQLASDRKFRAMLDDAGEHYGFHTNK